MRPISYSPKQVKVALLMFAFSIMSYFDRTIMSIAGPGIMKEFSITPSQMGVVYSAFLFSYTLFMIPGGYWADRFGGRLILSAVGIGSGLFTAFTALGGRPGLGTFLGVLPAFIVIRLGLGVVTAPIFPACGRVNADWMTPPQRGRVQGLINGGTGLGAAVSPMLFSFMIRSYGWRLSFAIAGLATILLAVVWYIYVRDKPSGAALAADARRATPWKRLLMNRNIVFLTLGYVAVDYFQYIFFYWLYYYLGEVRGLRPDQTAVYTTIPFLVWPIMALLGGWLVDRVSYLMGRRRGFRLVAVAGLSLAAGLLLVAARTQEINLSVGLISLALGFSSVSGVAFWASTIVAFEQNAGTAGGIMNCGGNVGGLFAPVITPIVAEHFGWTWGLYAGSLAAVVGMLTWMWIDVDSKFDAS
jgi:ACS family glucarate transporter-like MFS transporter